MDVSKYDFACQKALHLGLQYARSLGHQLLEVEHVSLALLRTRSTPLPAEQAAVLKKTLEDFLAKAPRLFGGFKIEFGKRLNAGLDRAESRLGKDARETVVTESQLWEALSKESTVIRNFFVRQSGSAEKLAPEEPFRPLVETPEQHSASKKGKEKLPSSSEHTVLSEMHQSKLKPYTVDLSAKAERNELDPVLGRDHEVRRALEILGRKKKNNPILIGEPGVGKSAIAEAIALRIASGKVPETIKGKRVLSLDLGAIIAGARFRGEFEARMKGILEAIEASAGQIILFIDEIHMLVGAGNVEGSADAANLLKPALARGDLRCVGATTLDEFRKHIEKDPALERRFQPLTVEEPTPQAALSILRGLKSRYEIHHGVQITDEALRSAVELSVRYINDRRLPDKAIDLVDEACSRLRMQIDSMPAVLDSLRATIEETEIERKAIASVAANKRDLASLDVRLTKARTEYQRIEAIWLEHKTLIDELRQLESKHEELGSLLDKAKASEDFDFAAKVQFNEEPRVRERMGEIQSRLDGMHVQHPFLHQFVTAREIAEVIAAWTRIPAGKLLEDDREKIKKIESRLRQRVFGQDDTLTRIAQAIRRARTGVSDPNRPTGIFLFLGPTGVGKTETAKAIAEELFDDESRMLRLDMSEFMESHSVSRLIGSPPGYVGFGEGAELVDGIREKPFSVVLFDEIEKAHPKVLDILLQVFEDGRLTDARGRTADFRHSILIMTSNLVTQEGGGIRDQDLRAHLGKLLRPEFVNRIDEIVQFRRLSDLDLSSLVDRLLNQLNHRLRGRQFRLSLGPVIRAKLVKAGKDPASGGRGVRRLFEQIVVNGVSDRIVEHPDFCLGAWVVDVGAGDRGDNRGDKMTWSQDFDSRRALPPARPA